MERLPGHLAPLLQEPLVLLPTKVGLMLVAVRGVVRQAARLVRELKTLRNELRK